MRKEESTTFWLTSKDDCFLLLCDGADVGGQALRSKAPRPESMALPSSGAGFLNRGTIDIWGRITLCGGDCPIRCRMFSSIPAKRPLGSKINPGGKPLIEGETSHWRRCLSITGSLNLSMFCHMLHRGVGWYQHIVHPTAYLESAFPLGCWCQ